MPPFGRHLNRSTNIEKKTDANIPKLAHPTGVGGTGTSVPACHPSLKGKKAGGHDCMFSESIEKSTEEGVVTYHEESMESTMDVPCDLVIIPAAHILVAFDIYKEPIHPWENGPETYKCL